MKYNIIEAVEILSRTPFTLESLLSGLSDNWIYQNEGPDTWSPYDVLGHLIHGEKTDWIPRTKIILSDLEDKTFVPFDRFAQLNADKSLPIKSLLSEFKTLRIENLETLKSLDISSIDLAKKGNHPALGPVTLSELLATWVTHDLGHIVQIARVMSMQYKNEVGPWKAYLGGLKS